MKSDLCFHCLDHFGPLCSTKAPSERKYMLNRNDVVLAISDKGPFSEKWIKYCQENKVKFQMVDCYDTSILETLRSCNALLWNWTLCEPKWRLIPKQLTAALEQIKFPVFPSIAEGFYYDDKIAQKYLLESIGAPVVPTYLFYSLDKALDWVGRTTFPKVFKLRCGAGGENVILVESLAQAQELCRKAFSVGFRPVSGYFSDLSSKISRIAGIGNFLSKLKNFPASIKRIQSLNQEFGNEFGYIYFQDFLEGNHYDIRVTVIFDRIFGFLREVRPGDFRASGSKRIHYDPSRVPESCVRTASETARKLNSNCIAFDFLQKGNDYLISEISYCFVGSAIEACTGYWDHNLIWHSGISVPEEYILERFLETRVLNSSPLWEPKK